MKKLVFDVFHNFQTKPGNSVHLFGRTEHAHPRNAQIMDDLGARPVGAQHASAVTLSGNILDRCLQRINRIDKLSRRLWVAQNYHHAATFIRDALVRQQPLLGWFLTSSRSSREFFVPGLPQVASVQQSLGTYA